MRKQLGTSVAEAKVEHATRGRRGRRAKRT